MDTPLFASRCEWNDMIRFDNGRFWRVIFGKHRFFHQVRQWIADDKKVTMNLKKILTTNQQRVRSTAFTSFSFFDFRQLEECRHEHIHVEWELNMNDCKEILAFVGGSKILPAKHDEKPVTKEVWMGKSKENVQVCHNIFL
jgi:hypothetical protein